MRYALGSSNDEIPALRVDDSCKTDSSGFHYSSMNAEPGIIDILDSRLVAFVDEPD
jgi:hypothetical protein